MAFWNIWTFGTFYGHLVILVLIWFIFPRFGILCKEKSGNPAFDNNNFFQFRI
jgi:hypothetical protein